MSDYRITYDTLLGGYSIERLATGKRGYRGWLRISNHRTYDDAKAAFTAFT